MSATAGDLAQRILEKRMKVEEKAFQGLKQKVVDATTLMIVDMQYSIEFDLSDEDMLALGRVTEGMRELGYKFRFIEVQNPAGETIKNKLHISVTHLVGNG